MRARPTHEDADLILRLYELRREPRMREARRWFMSSFHVSSLEEFQRLCPPGSEENASYRMVVTYWEMAASFVTNGVLHPQLFFQSNQELVFVYERVRELLPHSRAFFKNPMNLRNLEAVAKAHMQWWQEEGNAPEFHTMFTQMVRNAGRPPVQPAPEAQQDDEAH